MLRYGALFACFVFASYLMARTEALMCWSCSSDLDSRCHDHFNTTKFEYGRFNNPNVYGGGGYDPNYNRGNYQGGYNNPGGYNNQGGYNNPGQYNNQFQTGPPRYPYLKPCSSDLTGIYDKKFMCMKRVQTSNDGRRITIRDCKMVPVGQSTGSCPTESNPYQSIDFCEYCDHDGCNSAGNLKINYFLGLIAILCLWYKS